MERDVGIVGYLTSTPGLGGTLKSVPEDFVVEELSSPPPKSGDGRFTIATVRVRNWETNRLVREMARVLHISRRRIGFGGTKDKRAVTTQMVSVENVPPETVLALHLGDVEILDAYRSDSPLEIGDLVGNRFRIVVRDLVVEPEDAARVVTEGERELRRAGGFPSFFGVQRFATSFAASSMMPCRPTSQIPSRGKIPNRMRLVQRFGTRGMSGWPCVDIRSPTGLRRPF